MSTILSTSAPATFEIKSANLPLVSLLLKSSDMSRLYAEFAQRFGDMPDFFDQDPLVVDLTPLQTLEPGAGLDFSSLLNLLRTYQLAPVAVRGADEDQLAAALAHGLVAAPDVVVQRAAEVSSELEEPIDLPTMPNRHELPTAVAPLAAGALVIDKPLRSGQQVYARGRDLVVMAMVNPGAEVIADGHIHVYAPLRGKAIAGARGNGDARIFALSMAPELISIAGIYRTSEVPWPDTVLGRAAQVRLLADEAGEKLVVDALKL